MPDSSSHTQQRIQNLLTANTAFVCYKTPNTQQLTLIVQNNNKLHTTTSFDRNGFIMAAFDSNKKAVLFPKDQSKTYELPLPDKKNIVLSDIQQNADFSKKNSYIKLLNKTIQYIKKGFANKIVISRCLKYPFENTQAGSIFENLILAYPDAMVYIWHHPKIGLWMGATPEKLLHLKLNKMSTMALAGTQVFKENIVWGKKEKDEQKWVTDYIVHQLEPITEKLCVSKPFTHKAGHLAHLKSDIYADLLSNHSLTTLIDALHPTPAVCGTPKKNAKDFILQNENYPREFYTGFLGLIDKSSKTQLFVNLRCMQIKEQEALLYVGGGITKDSIAEKEWEETENKAKTLGHFL